MTTYYWDEARISELDNRMTLAKLELADGPPRRIARRLQAHIEQMQQERTRLANTPRVEMDLPCGTFEQETE